MAEIKIMFRWFETEYKKPREPNWQFSNLIYVRAETVLNLSKLVLSEYYLSHKKLR